jgi:hypothetical protein
MLSRPVGCVMNSFSARVFSECLGFPFHNSTVSLHLSLSVTCERSRQLARCRNLDPKFELRFRNDISFFLDQYYVVSTL